MPIRTHCSNYIHENNKPVSALDEVVLIKSSLWDKYLRCVICTSNLPSSSPSISAARLTRSPEDLYGPALAKWEFRQSTLRFSEQCISIHAVESEHTVKYPRVSLSPLEFDKVVSSLHSCSTSSSMTSWPQHCMVSLEATSWYLEVFLHDLDYADDIAIVGENRTSVQHIIDNMVEEASRFGLQFAPAKCKMLVQDWSGSPPILSVSNTPVELVNSFTYLGSIISVGSCGVDEIENRIGKARLAFEQLRHLWRRRDISLHLKGRVYKTTVRAVLLYSCETWPLRSEDIRQLAAFDHRCMRQIARIWWEQHVTNLSVRQLVLGPNSPGLDEVIKRHQLRWLGHVLRMPPERIPRLALLATPRRTWKKRRGGQPVTWKKNLKKLTAPLAAIGCARLPGWGPKDDECTWLATLEDMAVNRNQWRCCCDTLLPTPRPPKKHKTS